MDPNAEPSVDGSDIEMDPDRWTYLDERAELKAQIAEFIEPYRWSRKLPPFTFKELITMAIVSNRVEFISREGVYAWILKRFKYYGNLAIDEYTKSLAEGGIPSCVMPGYDADLFAGYTLPLIAQFDDDEEDEDYYDYPKYSVDIPSARILLRNWLEPDCKGPFRFLDLPPEIRNEIYEMTLQYPSSGLRVKLQQQGDFAIRALQRDHDEDLPISEWEENSRRIIVGRPQDILAITRVCKQVYKESATTFYEINNFCFASIETLAAVGRRMPIKGFKGIQQIYVQTMLSGNGPDTREWNPAEWITAMEVLAKHKSYKRLHIELREREWLNMHRIPRKLLGRTERFTEISQIAGFHRLAVAASKAEEFELHGFCPNIQAFMDKEVSKLKAGTSKNGKREKMRSEGGSEEGDE